MRGLTLVMLCGMLGGCSSSAYEAAYVKRVADHRAAAEFSALRPASTSFGDGLTGLRLPAVLLNQLDGNDPARPARPPFIPEFPGFASAFEAPAEVADGTVSVMLTVGVVPGDRRQEAADSILRQVRQDEEFRKATWQKGREVVDLNGATRKWDVLELKGPQLFQVTKADLAAEKRIAGTTEVWLSADPRQKACTILAWRVPDDAAASLPLPATSTLTARSVLASEP